MSSKKDLSKLVLRKEISSRGGGIEIDLTTFGFTNEKMSAYQNYLGGGMLGRIQANNTVVAYNKPHTEKQAEKLKLIEERLKRYFHELTNPDSEWESQTYEENQKISASAY